MLTPAQIQISKRNAYRGHAAAVFGLCRGTEDHLFYSAAGDGIIACWNLNENGGAQAFARMQGSVFSLALSSDSKALLAGTLQGQLAVFDHADRNLIYSLDQSGRTIFSIIPLGHGETWVAGTKDGSLLTGNTREKDSIREIRIADNSIRCISLSADGQKMAIGSSDHRIYILDTSTLEIEQVLTGHTQSVFSVAWMPGDKYVLSGSRDATLRVWDPGTGHAQELAAHMYTINDIAFHPEGRIFATAGRDKHIKIWDTNSFSLLRVIDSEKYAGHINSVNKLFWSRWNNCLISCGDDRSILVWDIDILT